MSANMTATPACRSPDHISARPEDLPSADRRHGGVRHTARRSPSTRSLRRPCWLSASSMFTRSRTATAGFTVPHPPCAGASAGSIRPGVVFPVSAAILERIDDYRRGAGGVFTAPLAADRVGADEDGNVSVLNDTADFYRFFDATPHAEFLYGCVEKTIDEDLPRETDFLRRYDRFRERDSDHRRYARTTIDLLFRFLQQNEGRLSRRAATMRSRS